MTTTVCDFCGGTILDSDRERVIMQIGLTPFLHFCNLHHLTRYIGHTLHPDLVWGPFNAAPRP